MQLVEQVRLQIDPMIDLEEWKSGVDTQPRIENGWSYPGAPAVKKLAEHGEILELLECCYGRLPFAFQTGNFPVGSNQKAHREIFNFNASPDGFIAGVWIALEDVNEDAGPLAYWPGTHRLPDTTAIDFGTAPEQGDRKARAQALPESYWETIIKEGNHGKHVFLAKAGDVMVLHAKLIHCDEIVLNRQLTRWCQITHYLFEGCKFRAAFRQASTRNNDWKTPYDIQSSRQRPKPLERTIWKIREEINRACKKDRKTGEKEEQPLIDQECFPKLVSSGKFGSSTDVAIDINSLGYGKLAIRSESWLDLIDRVREDLEPLVDQKALAEGLLPPTRLQDAWKWQGLKSVQDLACHTEILASLSVMYGREPFAFQTLNFPNGTAQHFHSDAVHFHSKPHGFMCGVWVALEDISEDSGPLLYYPGSHREEYLYARDLGVTTDELMAEKSPQRLFEKHWRGLVKEKGYKQELFIAKKGEVLLWHANLLHGGSGVKNKCLSRWSQVTHYFFRDCEYTTPLMLTTDTPADCVKWVRNPSDVAKGC